MLPGDQIVSILKNICQTDDISLVNWDHNSASVPAENWCNNIVRIDVEASVNGSKINFHWVGKFPSEKGTNQEFVAAARCDKKEIMFYSFLVPKLNEFSKGHLKLNICPVYYSNMDTENPFIVMENLKEQSYLGSVNKIEGLDVEHCRTVVEELAKFHATSHAYLLLSKDNDEKTKFLMEDHIFNTTHKMVKSFNDDFGQRRFEIVRQTLNYIQESNENWPKVFNALLNGRTLQELRTDSTATLPADFNVLIHNDLWICNMLFKYELQGSNKPCAVCFVDWAVVCHANPAVDLVNFFMTSANPEVLDFHFEDLMRCYHSTLMESLKKLNVTAVDYSFERLMADYDRRIFWGSLQGLTWIPINIADGEDFSAVQETAPDLGQGDDFGRYIMAVGKVTLERKIKTHPYMKPRLRALFRHVMHRNLTPQN